MIQQTTPAQAGLAEDLWRVLEAAHRRIFPADDGEPDAVDIGSAQYLARMLAVDDGLVLAWYRVILLALDESARVEYGYSFPDSSNEQKDALLSKLEAGALSCPLSSDMQSRAFETMVEHVREGLFTDPVHGGNRDGLGWRVLGHPGPRLANSIADAFAVSDTPPERYGETCRYGKIDQDELAARCFADGLRDHIEEVDAVVVGVGAIGAIAVSALVKEGLSVVGLEAGPWRTGREFAADELTQTFYGQAKLGPKFNDELPSWRPDASTAETNLQFSLGRMVNGVGGSFAQYAAWLRRFHEWHFRPHSHLVDRFGARAIPEDSTLADWPISYAELEPFYSRAEHLMGVSGDDSNPFVRRATPLPMPPLREFPLGQLFHRVATEHGLHPYPVPAGINSVPYDGRPATNYSAWSNGFGILDSDRWHPQLHMIPDALRSDRFSLRTHCRVLEILTRSDGSACGVRYLRPDGREVVQPARAVIVAAYTFETVRLLALSRDAHHPDGLGNNYGQLGQHFMPKMFVNSYGRFPGRRFNRHAGPAAQAVAVDDYLAGELDANELGFVGGGTLSVAQQALPLQISREFRPSDVPGWGRAYREHLLEWQGHAGVWTQPDTLPYLGNFLDLDPRRKECTNVGLPVVRVTFSPRENERRLAQWLLHQSTTLLKAMGAETTWNGPTYSGAGSSHDLGGCRAGADPTTSVVDANLEVHDTPRLYVFSGAVLPSCPGINPTLTISAWVLRAVENLATQLK